MIFRYEIAVCLCLPGHCKAGAFYKLYKHRNEQCNSHTTQEYRMTTLNTRFNM